MLGIIASSGVPQLGADLGLQPRDVATPYEVVTVRVGKIGGQEVACIARHGEGPPLPPHRVNYRANVWALAELGCRAILATNAVGSLCPSLRPGTFCVPAQLLDFTSARPRTFYEEEMVAVDFTEPYCARLSALVASVVKATDRPLQAGLTYACTEGPRFETAAEIRMLRLLGADVVGMTAIPEAVLAREKGLCYASLCVVTNLAAGIEGHHPSAEEVTSEMERCWQALTQVIQAVAAAYHDDPSCPCHGRARS
ncbi:MAG: S-methyl-5'-thioinosine phosphorylase [Armatimonadetes bacterium]|nr:S-methyl-5'-thioinosine phosphorylase [Armatimonadota bacterium]